MNRPEPCRGCQPAPPPPPPRGCNRCELDVNFSQYCKVDMPPTFTILDLNFQPDSPINAYRWDMVDAGVNFFTVPGDQTKLIGKAPFRTIRVMDSTGNDGDYFNRNDFYDADTDTTKIEVFPFPPSNMPGGTLSELVNDCDVCESYQRTWSLIRSSTSGCVWADSIIVPSTTNCGYTGRTFPRPPAPCNEPEFLLSAEFIRGGFFCSEPDNWNVRFRLFCRGRSKLLAVYCVRDADLSITGDTTLTLVETRWSCIDWPETIEMQPGP